MGSTPQISIIIPAYNVEKYIEETLRSIAKQTFSDFEVLVIDDGSDDGTFDIVKSIASQDRRIKIYTQDNSGQGKARNTGIDNAQGEYLTFVDSDDLVLPDYLSTMYKKMVSNSQVDIIALPHSDIGFDELHNETAIRRITSSNTGQQEFLSGNAYVSRSFTENGAKFNVSFVSKLFRKSLFENYRIPEGHFFEDLAGVPELMLGAQRILWIDSIQYLYLVNRPNSTMTDISVVKAKDVLWALHHLETFLKTNSPNLLSSFQVLIANNISMPFSVLRSSAKYRNKMRALTSQVSIIYLLRLIGSVHISKRGIIALFLLGFHI